MEEINYESVLIGLTYLDTFFNHDYEHRDIILEASSTEEVLDSMVTISMMLTGILAKSYPEIGTHKDIINIVRQIALKKSD